MVSCSPSTALSAKELSNSNLRIVLETDSPYMVPNNVYEDISLKGKKLPICHSGMIPWTAKFVARVANEGSNSAAGVENPQTSVWDADRVMAVARENAKTMYGI